MHLAQRDHVGETLNGRAEEVFSSTWNHPLIFELEDALRVVGVETCDAQCATSALPQNWINSGMSSVSLLLQLFFVMKLEHVPRNLQSTEGEVGVVAPAFATQASTISNPRSHDVLRTLLDELEPVGEIALVASKEQTSLQVLIVRALLVDLLVVCDLRAKGNTTS